MVHLAGGGGGGGGAGGSPQLEDQVVTGGGGAGGRRTNPTSGTSMEQLTLVVVELVDGSPLCYSGGTGGSWYSNNKV